MLESQQNWKKNSLRILDSYKVTVKESLLKIFILDQKFVSLNGTIITLFIVKSTSFYKVKEGLKWRLV